MKPVQGCLSARNNRQSRFHNCGGLVRPVPACLTGKKERELTFTTVELHSGSCRPVEVAGMIEKALFTTVEFL